MFWYSKIVSYIKKNSPNGKKQRNGAMSLSSTDIKDIRKFGIVAFIFFGFLAALGYWKQKFIFMLLFGLLSLMGMGFILLPVHLYPMYQAWLKFAHFMNRAVTLLILTIAYYLVITPSALVKRMISGRPLPIKPDPNVASYWVSRSEPAQPKERFLKRF